MMFWNEGHWVFWQVALMWFAMIAFWGLIAWAVYAIVKSSSQSPTDKPFEDARRTLDKRLAQGEISTDEYRQVLDLLNSNSRKSVSTGSAQ